ncbi:type 4a pilus biogenesis protein PilO [Leifsonia sp. P73]|uniref:type 4a pilus biogenesis protein PilO n=1 Tax=Leifsonia sp. P73 TaxID=3423959 RepID=UPI003DA21E14
MDKNKIWIAGSVLLMIVALGLGWFLGIAPQLASAATAESQRADVQALNAKQEATLASLKKDYANLDELNAQLSDLSDSVPSDTAIPAFVDEVDALGSAAGVTVAGISVADAKPYEPVSPPAPTGGAATPSPTATPSPGATPTPTPTPSPTPVAGMPPVTSSKLTSVNFSSLAVTLTVKGTYAQGLSFVNGIQTGKRLFLVSGINTSTASSGGTAGKPSAGSETTTITGLIFVVTPTKGAPTPAPTPSK